MKQKLMNQKPRTKEEPFWLKFNETVEQIHQEMLRVLNVTKELKAMREEK